MPRLIAAALLLLIADSVAAAEQHAYVVPVVTAKVKDRIYSTTLALRNDGAENVDCEAIYAVPNDPRGGTLRSRYTVPHGGRPHVEEDVLMEVGAVGTMRIVCSGQLAIAARIQASVDGGKTFDDGRTFAGLDDAAAFKRLRIVKASSDVLVAEVAGKSVTVEAVVRNGAGAIIGRKTYEIPAFAQQIVNLSKLRDGSEALSVELHVLEGDDGALVAAEETHDPTLLKMAVRMTPEARRAFNDHQARQLAAATTASAGPSITEQLLLSPFKAAPFRDPATGLVLMRDRWYDPSTGTFLTPDPNGYGDSSNLYLFGKGDPVNHSDPRGREAIPASERTQIQCRTGVLNASSETCQRALHPEKFPELTGRGHVLEAYATEPVYISLASIAVHDANTRLDMYASGLPGIEARVQELIARGVPAETAYRWGYELRGALMAEARDASSPLGRYIAEMMKKEQPPPEFFIQKYGSAEQAALRLAKSNPFVTRTMVGVRVAGTAVVIVGVGLSAREVMNAPPLDRWHVLARESGGVLGSTAGAWGGMKLGGLIGGDVGGPPGAAVGAFVGGCIGACIGNSAGQALIGDALYQYTVPSAYGGRR